MITKELLEFIKSEQEASASREGIKKTLLEKGWNERDVDQAFVRVDSGQIDIFSGEISVLVRRTWETYSANWKVYAGAMGVYVIASIITVLLIGGICYAAFASHFDFGPLKELINTPNPSDELVVTVLANLIANSWWIILGVLFLVLGICVTKQIANGVLFMAQGADEKLKPLLKKSMNLLWQGLIVLSISFCLGMVIALGGFIIPALMAILLHSLPMLAIGIPITIVLLIVILPYIAFVVPALYRDGHKGWSAFTQSITLVQGRWSFVWMRLFMASLIMIALSIVTQFLGGMFSAVVSTFIFTPCMAIYLVHLYEFLKSPKNPLEIKPSIDLSLPK